MAQYIVPLDIQDGNQRYEVMMLSSGKDGNVTTVHNPMPVEVRVADGAAGDAFGRLRVSEAFTLGDYKHVYGIDTGNFNDLKVDGGDIVFQANKACARLSTSTGSTSRAVHQTKMYHNYMPGKSQLIKSTVNFYSAVANTVKRTGYFDDLNGVFFQQDGDGTLSFVIRTNTSGTASDARKVTQANWNIDKCNGTGPSGLTLDITKTQIVFFDFQWLGVGRVRCGFVHNGRTIVAHEFYNSNVLDVVYMSNPNLPVRCEIANTGTSVGGYFDQICASVVSEGGYVESGRDWALDGGITAETVTTSADMPIIAIRLKNTFNGYPNRAIVRMQEIGLYAETNPIIWKLIRLPGLSSITLSSPTWTSVSDTSTVEYSLLATAISGGDVLISGFAGASSPGGSNKGMGSGSNFNPTTAKKNFISQSIDSSDSEIYVLTARAIGANAQAWANIQWREIF